MTQAARKRVTKRFFDVVVCSVALLLTAPLLAGLGVWVWVCSPGPIFYRARRAGLHGQPFDLLKLRTMVLGADRRGAITGVDDQRVLPLGGMIRLLRLDELPQLLNILRGEMSLVGPRPEDLRIVDECYGPDERSVLGVLPGLAGIPQVSFLFDVRDIDPGDMDPEEHYRQIILPLRLALDREYVRTQSFWLDLRLLGLTGWCIAVKSWFLLARPERRRLQPVGRFNLGTR